MKSRKYMNKIHNRNGFTLAELLVTVSIIGVLVAVSIPIFASQLSKSKLAVDQANVRSAKAAALVEYMSSNISEEITYYYNAASGTIQKNIDGILGYGKTTDETLKVQTGATGDPVSEDGTAAFVAVTIPPNLRGNVTLSWGTSEKSDSNSTQIEFVAVTINKILQLGNKVGIASEKSGPARKSKFTDAGDKELKKLLETYDIKNLPENINSCNFTVYTDSPEQSFKDLSVAVTFQDKDKNQYIFYKSAVYTASSLVEHFEKDLLNDKNNGDLTTTSNIIENLLKNSKDIVIKNI